MTRATYVTTTRLQLLKEQITERDQRILADVATFRVMSGRQLQRLHFHTTDGRSAEGRAARRALLRLSEHQLLQPLERRVGGVRGGSAGHLYVLGAAGVRLFGVAARARHREPGWPFLNHALALSELYTDLATDTDTSVLTVETEPSCWRSFEDTSGVVTIKPDAYLHIERNQRRSHWFIEIDMGTEGSTSIRRKMTRYLAYANSGHEQRRHAGVVPRVLWHTTNADRATVIERLAAETRGPPGLHVTTGLLPEPERRNP